MINVDDLKAFSLLLINLTLCISTSWMLKLDLYGDKSVGAIMVIVFTILTIGSYLRIGKREEKGGVSKCSG